jgi:hypothetical protein
MRLLQSIEEGKSKAFRYYLPMREAVVLLCERQSKGRDAIISRMISQCRTLSASRGAAIAKNNEKAFYLFETAFYPKIRKYVRQFLREPQTGCKFGGVTLIGAPHLQVIDTTGASRYIVLLPGTWEPDDLKAYLELLSIVVEQCFGPETGTLWPLDLKKGVDIKWRSSTRMRQRCENAAKLYNRLMTAFRGQP